MPARGFTLFEMLIVIGLMTILASFSTYEGLSAFERSLGRSNAQSVEIALQQARSKAMRGVCGPYTCTEAPRYGVRVNTDGIVVFRGTSYEDRIKDSDILYTLEPSSKVTSSQDVVYQPGGTLEAGASSTIHIEDSTGRAREIVPNADGTVTIMP